MKVKDIDVMQVYEGNPHSCAKKAPGPKACKNIPKMANAQISLQESEPIALIKLVY